MPFYQTNFSPQYKSYYAIWYFDNVYYSSHFHPNMEFIHVLEGCVTVYYEEKQFVLHAGEHALILPNHIHSFNKDNQSKTCICSFSTDYVPTFYNSVRNKTADTIVFQIEKPVIDFLLYEFAKKSSLSVYEIKAIAYTICMSFARQVKLQDQAGMDLLHKLLTYITENYTQDISLKNAADYLGYEQHYLSKCFHNSFPFSFTNYVNQLRISDAKSLLIDTNESITNISSLCGFSSIRTFNRVFAQECGMTPKDYRKSILQTGIS